jgi:GTP 3',8-cyclase
MADLVDPHGRTVRDLRISVTDRCNFRCTYCMPEEGMQWLPRSELLTFEELERVARVCVERFDVDGLRLTGGEPTLRADLHHLVERLAALRTSTGAKPDISITTNGSTLRLLAERLRNAGLDRVNVSLDSLQRERFAQMTRRDDLAKVLDGIAAAKEVGFDPIKVNAVVERGVNDDEIVDLCTWARREGLALRFIEWMPLDAGDAWQMSKVVSQHEILERINAVYPLVPAGNRGAAPADRWLYADGHGDVGVIPSVTQPFCGDCDRVRITAEGQFRTCLFETREFDLRAIMRAGGSGDMTDAEIDDALAAEIVRAVGTKWAGHQIGQVHFIKPKRGMSQIGG